MANKSVKLRFSFNAFRCICRLHKHFKSISLTFLYIIFSSFTLLRYYVLRIYDVVYPLVTKLIDYSCKQINIELKFSSENFSPLLFKLVCFTSKMFQLRKHSEKRNSFKGCFVNCVYIYIYFSLFLPLYTHTHTHTLIFRYIIKRKISLELSSVVVVFVGHLKEPFTY